MTAKDDWKQRYLKEARHWEATDDLLRRVIGRLAIAAEGDSDDLDALLARMQRHARDGEDGLLESDLKDLATQINRMDGGRSSAHVDRDFEPPPSPGLLERDYCESLIDALDLKVGRGEELKLFRRQLHRMAPDQCLAELAAQISGLLGEEKSSDAGVREVLITLVDEIAVAQPGAGALETLRETLQRETGGDWRRILERVIGEIRSLIQRISSDKQALEQLVQDVSNELVDISEVLVDEHGELTAGREQSLALHEVMDRGVQTIQKHIDTESDIERLKAGVSQSLEGIRNGITEFIEKDGARFAAAEARNEALQERVGRIEKEAQDLQKQLHRNQERLMHDPLTGVRSRLAYDEMLAQEMSRYRRYKEAFCLAVFDIDHFKRVNDSFGHSAGDKALKLVAGMLDERVRETDYIFRVGGEEFVLLLPRTGLESAAALAEGIRQAVGDSGFHYESNPVPITLSAGITVVRDEDTAETLFNRADDAMYRAKKGGRDRLVSLP